MRTTLLRITAGIALFAAAAPINAQLKPLTPGDYGQFEAIAPGLPTLSPDGKWLAVAINRSNRNNELRITSVATGDTKAIAFGAQPAFSSDSHWIAYAIGLSEAQEDKLKKDKKPSHRKLGLMNLATGEQCVLDSIESFAFSPNGAYLAMRHYAPEKANPTPPPADSPEADPAGATLIVRNLATGRDSTFGGVSEFAWQDLPQTGRLLALAISAEDKTGNGIQLFDPQTGSLRTLDSGPAIFSALAWRKKSADLAALRGITDDKHDGPTQIALAWTHLGEAAEAAFRFDPTGKQPLPAGTRTVSYRKPTWSDDGDIVFLGFAKWGPKPPKKDPDAEEKPGVDVWHWRDAEVMPRQKLSAKADRERNMLAAWHLASGQFVPLAKTMTERIVPLHHQKLALAADWTRFEMERSIGRPAADLSLVDLATGDRTKIKDAVPNDNQIQASPNGRYLLFLESDHFWTVDTTTRAIVNITKGVPAQFIDRESDFTVKQKPAFGVAGWLKDDAAVLLYDKFDIWQISPDGKQAKKLTDGAASETRHHYVKLDPDEESIDPAKPLYLSLFGIWNKKSGYARLDAGREQHLLLEDKQIGRLAKARDADALVWTAETFGESPALFVAGGDLKTAQPVARTNEFQSKYAWGRAELIEYRNSHGSRLQGTLYYPAGYESGKKYPMIVYLYEKLSDGIHRYIAPSERDYYNAGAITSNGYFLLMPDIVFQPREPGVSVADCVTAAVKTVLAKGNVDAKKVGVVGHSWGGFDTTYLATHTSIFSAAVAGAPITDLVSNYGNHHWQSGIAETDHIETGQQRMEVPLWEDLPAYIRNSALFNVQNMTTPLLIEVGDADGTVFYHQGIELYNVARRAGKEVVLIVYAGEDHGLRKKADQIDYQRRLFDWFGHYLKGETAPEWIATGEPFLKQSSR